MEQGGRKRGPAWSDAPSDPRPLGSYALAGLVGSSPSAWHGSARSSGACRRPAQRQATRVRTRAVRGTAPPACRAGPTHARRARSCRTSRYDVTCLRPLDLGSPAVHVRGQLDLRVEHADVDRFGGYGRLAVPFDDQGGRMQRTYGEGPPRGTGLLPLPEAAHRAGGARTQPEPAVLQRLLEEHRTQRPEYGAHDSVGHIDPAHTGQRRQVDHATRDLALSVTADSDQRGSLCDRQAPAQPFRTSGGATGRPSAAGPARSRSSCRWVCSACPSGGSSGR